MNKKIIATVVCVLLISNFPVVFGIPDLKPTKLEIVLPSDVVKVKEIPVFVVLKNDLENPVLAESNLDVDVRTFGNVHTESSQITIQKGKHYSMFKVKIDGDGGIAIASSGFGSDTRYIKFKHENDGPELKLRVAPNPIPPSSSAEVYVWLEQDGKPFVPKNDVLIKLASEDEDFLTFSLNDKFNSNPTTKTLTSSKTILLKAGESFAKSKIFSSDFISEFNPDFGPDLRHEQLQENEANEFVITALAEGFEGRQAEVRIQPAKTFKSVNESSKILSDPTITKVWAYPNTVFDEFEIIVAVYTQTEEKDRTVTIGDSETKLQNQINNINEENREIEIGEDLNDDELSNSCESCAPLVITDSDINAHISTNKLIVPATNTAKISASSFISKQNYITIPAASVGILGEGKISAVFDGTIGDDFRIEIEQPFDSEPKLGITPIPALDNQNQDLFMIYGVENNVISNVDIKDLVVSTNPSIDLIVANDYGTVKVVKGSTGDVSGLVDVIALADGMIPATTTLDIFSEPINMQIIPVKNEISFGNPLDLYYEVSPDDVKVFLETALPFDEIENGFRVYGITPGEHTLLFTAKNGGKETTNEKFTIKVNPLTTPVEEITNSVEKTSLDQIGINENFVYLIVLGAIVLAGIFLVRTRKFKTKSDNELEEEDLTF